MVYSEQPGRHGSVQLIRAELLDNNADELVPLPWLSLVRILGPRRAGREFGRGHEHHDGAGIADPWSECRMGRAILSGAAVFRPSTNPIWRRPDRRIPVPRCPLRKLVHPRRGPARDPA